MTTLELLKDARDRIAKGWTQSASARLANGRAVNPHNPHAVSFCASGALGANPNFDWLAVDRLVVDELVAALPEGTQFSFGMNAVTYYNDDPETTQDDVLALYDRAIQEVSTKPTATLASDLKTCYNP